MDDLSSTIDSAPAFEEMVGHKMNLVERLKYGLASIRFQLTLVVLAATLPMMIFVALFAGQQRQAATTEVEQQLLFSAKTAALGYDSTILYTRQMMQAVSRLPSLQQHDYAACNQDLEAIRRNYLIYLGLSVNDAEGKLLCSSPPVPAEMTVQSQADQSWFQAAVKNKGFTVGSYATGPVSNKGNLTFGYPVISGDGQIDYVIGAGVDIAALNETAAQLALPEGAVLRISDRAGTIILRVPNPELYVGATYPDFELLDEIGNKSEGVGRAIGVDGIARLYGFTTLPSDPSGQLVLAVGVPIEQAYEHINSNLIRNLVAIGSLALMGMALSWIITERYILRPAYTLTTASRRLTDGNLSARTSLGKGYGELFELGQDFDQMAESLEKQESELRALNQELEQRVADRTLELRQSRDLLQQFSNHLQNLLEEERKKISREIHDELGQALTGLKMDLKSINKMLLPDQDPIRQKIAASLQLVDNTISTMRRISSDLRPGILDDLGLIAAVEWLVTNFQNRTGIEVEFIVEPMDLEIPREMNTAMYRIIQEALTNVMRHSQASRVTISITGKPEEIEIKIQDNGRGFDDETIRRSRSLGLTGIRERALLIGGQAKVFGNSGVGTQVIICVPVSTERGEA